MSISVSAKTLIGKIIINDKIAIKNLEGKQTCEIVVFDNKGISNPSVINHKSNGYVCESTTFQDLMLGIEWCLKNDLKKDCKKISDDAILKYDYNGIIDRYINFLKK